MRLTEIKSDIVSDKYYKIEHESGLRIFVYPQKGYSSSYAVLGINYGSINTKFKVLGDELVTEVPDGIAHYLEHKLFENEDGDAFSRYAETGASANAYTAFNSTCYLFSCTKNFKDSLKILLDFVQSPYFTEETVRKEQGIIGQEIEMYNDDPNWRVLFNLLNAMYHEHPVKVDIAGSIESISKITHEKLYKCYNSFYNLNNMVLCVSGKVGPNQVLSIVDDFLKPWKKVEVKNIFPQEPYKIVEKRVEQKFDISMPMFELGFKEDCFERRKTVEELANTEILLEAFSSKSSDLYKKLIEAELINSSSFSYEYFEGPGYASVIFAGESTKPDKVSELIHKEVKKLHKNGVDPTDFEIAKKKIYGRNLASLNNPETIANAIVQFSFAQRELFDYIDAIVNTTVDSVNERLESQLDVNNSSLSIVSPLDKDTEE